LIFWLNLNVRNSCLYIDKVSRVHSALTFNFQLLCRSKFPCMRDTNTWYSRMTCETCVAKLRCHLLQSKYIKAPCVEFNPCSGFCYLFIVLQQLSVICTPECYRHHI
jgi:hypothetical protein